MSYYPQPTDEQKTKILQLTKRGYTTGEISDMLDLPERQVLYQKQKFPIKSRIVSVAIAPPSYWFWGIPYVAVVKANLADGREITIGAKRYSNPRRAQEDNERVLSLASQLIGKEVEYAARRAPRGTQARELHQKRYFEAKFAKLPNALKEEFRYR